MLDYGLVSNRQQAIMQTNDDLFQWPVWVIRPASVQYKWVCFQGSVLLKVMLKFMLANMDFNLTYDWLAAKQLEAMSENSC